MVCQPIQGYFMPKGERRIFIVCSYLYFCLIKWYLMPPCLTLSIIRYGSRVKWSNPGKGVAPSPTHWCSKQSKREPSGTLDYGRLLYLLTIKCK